MKMLKKGLTAMALLAAAAAIGCGSSASSSDATGAAGTGGAAGSGAAGSDPCGGITLYRLTMGDECYQVTSASNVSDGCNLGVGDPVSSMGVVGSWLDVNYTYDQTSTTLKVGTDASLGQGPIACNAATLSRDGDTGLPTQATCTWHQTDSSMVTMTADYEFDITVTENEDTFATACPSTVAPASGSCTSTWTWHMVRDTTKTAPGCM